MVISSSSLEVLIGYNTAPNYHGSRKQELGVCAELYMCRRLCTKSLYTCAGGSRQRQSSEKDTLKNRGRYRETPLRKGVLHFVLKAESYPVMKGWDPKHKIIHINPVESNQSNFLEIVSFPHIMKQTKE